MGRLRRDARAEGGIAILSVGVLVVGGLWYMRAAGRTDRVAALLGSAVLSVVIMVGVIANYSYNTPKPHIQPPLNGYVMLLQGLVFLAVVVLFLLAPALLSVTLNRLFS